MKKLLLFSWGYNGWGNHVKRFVQIVDALEAARGFKPPIFVDTRIARSSRTQGFNGPYLQNLLGVDRYRWMRGLGNRQIRDGGSRMIIDHPEVVDSLLDVAILASQERQRVVFYCQCPRQKRDGECKCHRWKVGELAIKAAASRNIPLEVVEWPGGMRHEIDFSTTRQTFEKLVKNACATIPLPKGLDPVDLEGPGWATVATITCGDERIHRLVGPALRMKGKWRLPLLRNDLAAHVTKADYREMADELLVSEGWEVRKARQAEKFATASTDSRTRKLPHGSWHQQKGWRKAYQGQNRPDIGIRLGCNC